MGMAQLELETEFCIHGCLLNKGQDSVSFNLLLAGPRPGLPTRPGCSGHQCERTASLWWQAALGLVGLNHFQKQQVDLGFRRPHIVCHSSLQRSVTNGQMEDQEGKLGHRLEEGTFPAKVLNLSFETWRLPQGA